MRASVHGFGYAGLRARVVAVVHHTLAHPAPVLAVAHGALFRIVWTGMGLPPTVRLTNGAPLFCDPGPAGAPCPLPPASA